MLTPSILCASHLLFPPPRGQPSTFICAGGGSWSGARRPSGIRWASATAIVQVYTEANSEASSLDSRPFKIAPAFATAFVEPSSSNSRQWVSNPFFSLSSSKYPLANAGPHSLPTREYLQQQSSASPTHCSSLWPLSCDDR